MKRFFVKASIGAAGLFALLVPQGCTNLDEKPPSLITPGNFYSSESEVLAALAGIYAQLRSTAPEGSIFDANEISTDEMVVPTRGSDWYDNGQWIDLHNMTWTPTSAASGFFNGAWNSAYAGIARANLFLVATQNALFPNKASYVAEVRALRAFYYYILMDFFGGVPVVTDTGLAKAKVARNTRREVFDFIEKELIAARDSGLPATRPPGDNGRFTQGGADAILANMYLNAGVFTKDGAGAGGISATAYNSCTGITVSGGQDACLAADSAATRLLNSPNYRLADSFPQNFRADNNLSPENIFVVKFIAQDGLGLDYAMAILHYNQYGSLTPWNGFAVQAQTYNAFDSTDKRRRVVLIGRQHDVLSGALVNDRAGNPLIFTDTIHNIHSATEGEGGRVYKWPVDPAHVSWNSGNDYAWFRLGEIYLIKAEVENELGHTGPALALLNSLRARRDTVAPPLITVNRSVVLKERLFELLGEGKRRQDLIRFGAYTTRVDDPSLSGGKTAAAADYYVLMPIPQTQVDANPLLAQNPGY
jgi:starch-binding outer membrane protein, SusD/RagB family